MAKKQKKKNSRMMLTTHGTPPMLVHVDNARDMHR
jgi:hypothetical protein